MGKKMKLKSILAMLIAIVFSLSTTLNVAAEVAEQPRVIKVRLFYDESMVYALGERGFTTAEAIENRFMQWSKLVSPPYLSELGLRLEFSVQRYEEVFGQTYAAQYGENCLWHLDGSNTNIGIRRRIWNVSQHCSCPAEDSYNHHTSGNRYLNTMNTYMGSHDNLDFDVATVITGHKLCYKTSPSGCGGCSGLSFVGGRVIAMCGSYYLNDQIGTEEIKNYKNMMQMKGVFWHEFGHCLGLGHYDAYSHEENSPCCMYDGLNETVFVNRLCCDVCLNIARNSTLCNGTSQDASEQQCCAYNMEEGEFFGNIEDYAESVGISAESMPLVQNIPDDAVIDGIRVFDDHTEIITSFPSRTSTLLIDETDAYSVFVLQKRRENDYQIDLVTDVSAYLEKMASMIGADRTMYGRDDVVLGYYGTVYATVKLNDGTYRHMQVGTQTLKIAVKPVNNVMKTVVEYTYNPIVVSLSEALAMAGFSDYTIE